jgi:hypothetical protein
MELTRYPASRAAPSIAVSIAAGPYRAASKESTPTVRVRPLASDRALRLGR